jgi:hypothetical protein
MPKKPIDYSKTVMYKIVCKDDDCDLIYVGSTTDFTRRKQQHKTRCKNSNDKHHHLKVYKTIRDNGDWENFKMIQIEKYPCQDSHDARKREDELMLELKANMNGRRALWDKKQYVEDNREQIKKYQKLYRKDNKDKIKIQRTQYREDNKETIKVKKKQYCEDNKETIKVKNQQYREDNKETIKVKKQQYREDNKETIKVKNQQYYEDNKDKIKERMSQQHICECGSTYAHSRKKRHERSKKHIKYMEQNL